MTWPMAYSPLASSVPPGPAMALPSLSAAFGFPMPPSPPSLHLTAAAGVSAGVTSYAASHCPFSQPTSSTLQLSPRPSIDGDFDHDVHSDCGSNSKYEQKIYCYGLLNWLISNKFHCLHAENGCLVKKEWRPFVNLAMLGLFYPRVRRFKDSVNCQFVATCNIVCPVNIEFETGNLGSSAASFT